jgi:hypothetical protein
MVLVLAVKKGCRKGVRSLFNSLYGSCLKPHGVAETAAAFFMKNDFPQKITQTILSIIDHGKIHLSAQIFQRRESSGKFTQGMNIWIKEMSLYLVSLFPQHSEWKCRTGTAADVQENFHWLLLNFFGSIP